ncbi:MAG: tetratricopeptide repeat protein [Devosia sp.]|nr:tetratricopeptide repeat protein [Devosia sp.]
MLRLFGAYHADLPGGRSADLPDKAYLLLALMDLEFGSSSGRLLLASRLWEQVPNPTANLRALLPQVRRFEEALACRVLHTSASRLWRDQACVRTDIGVFLSTRRVESADGLVDLLGLYRGDLLAGLRQSNGPVLSEWLSLQRAALRQRFIRLALPAAAAVGGLVGLEALRRLAQEAPYEDRVEQELLVLLAREHSAAAAAEEYGAFEARLRSELGVAPALETQSLVSMLRLAARPSPASAPAAVPARAAASAPAPAMALRSQLPTLLLLPPVVHGGTPTQGDLASAFVDDITYSLCRMKSFAVFAPFSARRVVPSATITGEVPYEADYVLSTRLLPDRDSGVRLGFGLTRSCTRQVIVGDHVRFAEADLPRRFGEISALVARVLAGEIERSELSSYRTRGEPSAYVNFLLGQELLRSVELDTVRRARRHLRQAIEVQPDFVPAICMLSRTHALEWLLLGRIDDAQLKEARRLASTAIEIDPLDAGGYRELGNADLYMQDLDASLERLQYATSRAPHHADVLLDCADSLLPNSRYEQARRTVEQALALNPAAPDEYLWVSATVQFFLHDYRTALATALRMTNPDPFGRFIAVCATLTGDRKLAARYRQRMQERQPDFRIADWRKLVPLKDEHDKRFFEDAMRKAGFH